jgi:hypothetical protein
MTSDWWLLAMIGSGIGTAASAAGTGALAALKGLGGLASTAGSGIANAATSAAHGLTGLNAAPTAGGSSVLPAAEIASAAPGAAGSAATQAAGGGTTAALPPLSAAANPTPTLSGLTNVPELGQYSAGAIQAPTPTTYPLSPAQGAVTPSAVTPWLSDLGQGVKTSVLSQLGVTNPNASLPNMLQQGLFSQVAGSPYFAPQGASFLRNLGGAVGQRLATSAFPQAGRQPTTQEQFWRMLMARNSPSALGMPVMGG